MFSSKEIKFIFEDILCNPVYINPKEISFEQLKVFEKFMEFINKENKVMLTYHRDQNIVANYNKLNGMPHLWDIVLSATEPKVFKEASSYLI